MGKRVKFGKLPPLPKDDDFSHWCPFECLEKDDYFPVIEYKAGCPVCGADDLQAPFQIMAIYQGREGVYHQFLPMEEIRCGTCGTRVAGMNVMCYAGVVDVTDEFDGIKK